MVEFCEKMQVRWIVATFLHHFKLIYVLYSICGLFLKIIVNLNELHQHMQLLYFDSYIFVCKQHNVMYSEYSLLIHIIAFSKYIACADALKREYECRGIRIRIYWCLH